MNTGMILNVRRTVAALVMAAGIALSAAYAPVLLEEVAGVDVSVPVFAGNENDNGGG